MNSETGRDLGAKTQVNLGEMNADEERVSYILCPLMHFYSLYLNYINAKTANRESLQTHLCRVRSHLYICIKTMR